MGLINKKVDLYLNDSSSQKPERQCGCRRVGGKKLKQRFVHWSMAPERKTRGSKFYSVVTLVLHLHRHHPLSSHLPPLPPPAGLPSSAEPLPHFRTGFQPLLLHQILFHSILASSWPLIRFLTHFNDASWKTQTTWRPFYFHSHVMTVALLSVKYKHCRSQPVFLPVFLLQTFPQSLS